jgi:transcriptional regulator with XRE-family HTH domain
MEEMTLDQLRTARGFTQAQVSKTLNVSQAAISKLEFRTDSYISSVRKFVEALGGKLEIHAAFPDRRIQLRGLDGDDTITNLRALVERQCRITPLQAATGDFNNLFRLRFIDDEERIVEVEKDTGQIVHIPLRRISEVLPSAPPHNLPTLVLRGNLAWFPETQRWRFVE